MAETADMVAQANKYFTLGPEKGYVIAYAHGTGDSTTGRGWNAGGCCADPVKNKVDDDAYFRAVIKDLIANWKVNPNRVFVTGFSNGGYMA